MKWAICKCINGLNELISLFTAIQIKHPKCEKLSASPPPARLRTWLWVHVDTLPAGHAGVVHQHLGTQIDKGSRQLKKNEISLRVVIK